MKKYFHLFDKVLTPEELAREEGYTAETHEIVTEDRYILDVHRISESPKNLFIKKKPPYYLSMECLIVQLPGLYLDQERV